MQPNTPVAPAGGFQLGGWYNGRQWNGTSFTQPAGVEAIGANTGQAVNPTVVAAGNAAQGLAPGTNEAYIAQQNGGAAPGATGGAAGGATNAPAVDVLNSPEIQAVQKQITDRQTALAAATTQINDNPFYSEATRVGKISSLNSKYLLDIAPYQSELSRLTDIAKTQYTAQQAAAKTSTSIQDIGGVSTAVTLDAAGNIVNKVAIGTSGKGTGTTPKTADYVSWVKTDAAAGKTLDDLMKYYDGYLTRQQIFDLYMSQNYYKNSDDQVAKEKTRWGVK